MRGISQAIPA